MNPYQKIITTSLFLMLACVIANAQYAITFVKDTEPTQCTGIIMVSVSEAELFGGTAVRPEWNAATHYVEYTVPLGGLKVWSGATARQPILKGVDEVNLPGGDSQLFIPDPYRQIGNEFENLTLNPMNW